MSITLLTMKQVVAKTGLSKSTIYERISEGKFPTGITIGERGKRWVDSEVDAYLAELITASRA